MTFLPPFNLHNLKILTDSGLTNKTILASSTLLHGLLSEENQVIQNPQVTMWSDGSRWSRECLEKELLRIFTGQ